MNYLTQARISGLFSMLLAVWPAMAASAEETAGAMVVEATAESGAWPTDEALEPGILPVKVRIANHSEQAVKLRYKDLALVGFSGDRYSALPIHNVLLSGGRPEDKARNKVSVEVPEFAQVSFRIAPAYSEIFPNSEAFPSHFDETREYTEYHRRQWNPERKPTLQMFARLLPEGVLGAGGFVSGFLYFQQVDGWERGLRLEMTVVTAAGDQVLATVNVPVTAAGER